MIKRYRLIVFVVILLGVGCSGGDDQSSLEESASKQSVKETILQGQIQALEKAKEVGLMLQTEAEKRRKMIEEGSN